MKTNYFVFIVVIGIIIIISNSCKKSENENFAPEIPNSPSPSNNELDVEISKTLSWNCKDINGDNIIYNIYFDTVSDPKIVGSNISSTIFNPGQLKYNTKYYWKVTARDDINSEEVIGPIWSFTTKQKEFGEIINLEPSNNESIIANSVTLKWDFTGSDDNEVEYDIYLDTIESPQILTSNIQVDTFKTDTLQANRLYYWRIIVKDDNGNIAEGPIWIFKIQSQDCGQITNLIPENNSNNVDQSCVLSWSCDNPDDNQLVYDIYFGTSITPELVAEDISSNTYNTGTLDNEETYFWKVIAKNNSGGQSTSKVLKFSTGDIIEYAFYLGNTNSNIEMVWIDRGDFMMGARSGEQGAMGDEYPRHQVSISEGFWMGKYEVTQEQWEAVAGNWNFYFNNKPQHPAEMISWNHIHTLFLERLNSGNLYGKWRLPSEAEWEYACRAGHNHTRFWWGNDENYTEIDDYAWCWQNNGHQTHEVGQKIPNPWGLYDMNGNVWEWCEDQYHNSYVGAPTDGSVWGASDDNGKVARGGGWSEYGAPFCRSSGRGRDNPAYGNNIFGFRLVKESF